MQRAPASSLPRLSWVDDLALPLALAVLTTDWLTLWVRWIVRLAASGASPADPALSPLLVAGLILTSIAVTRLALGSLRLVAARPSERIRRDPGARARRMVTASGLAAVVGALWLTYGVGFPLGFLRGFLDWGQAFPTEPVMLAVCVYAWWRGITIGQRRIAYDEFERAFYGGVFAFALLIGLDRWPRLLAPGEAFWSVLLYFALGLSALALLSFERARRQQKEAGGVVPGFNRYWLGTVGSVIGLILAGGLAVANLVVPQSVARVLGFANIIVDAVTVVLLYLLVGVSYVAFWLLEPLIPILLAVLRALANAFKFPTPSPEAQAQFAEFQAVVQAILQSPAVRYSTRGLAILIVVGSIAFVFWVALRRFRWLLPREVNETRESIASRELLLAQLRNLLSRLRPTRPAPPLSDYLPLLGPPDDPRQIIRRAYQGLLDWARSRSTPRAAGQTPARFGDALARTAPDSQEPISILTRAYIRARYGFAAPSPEDAQAAQDALKQLPITTHSKGERK